MSRNDFSLSCKHHLRFLNKYIYANESHYEIESFAVVIFKISNIEDCEYVENILITTYLQIKVSGRI